MNVTAFGTTGHIGREVVHRLLDADHQVVAYVRTPSELRESHPHLTVHTGEFADVTVVREAIRGAKR